MIVAKDCVFVLKNLTAHFQPLDLNASGKAKQFLKHKLESPYVDQVTKNIKKGTQ